MSLHTKGGYMFRLLGIALLFFSIQQSHASLSFRDGMNAQEPQVDYDIVTYIEALRAGDDETANAMENIIIYERPELFSYLESLKRSSDGMDESDIALNDGYSPGGGTMDFPT